MSTVANKETVPWLVSFPDDDKITRHLRSSLIVACRGHERIASVLDYFLFTASWEAKNQGVEKGCNVVEITRTHKEINEKLTFNVSRKTLIHYLDTLNDWGYVLSKPYGRTFSVQFESVQKSINEPPAINKRSPRQRDCQKGCKTTTCEKLQPSFEEWQQKVELLQLKVEDLQLKVVTLQQKVEEPSTLQRCFQALGRLLEDHNFSPTDYTNLLLSITNLRESSVVVSQNTTNHSLSEENVNLSEEQKNYNILPGNESTQREIAPNDTASQQLPHQGSEQTPPTLVASGNHAPPFMHAPLQPGDNGTPLSLDGRTMAPPTVSVTSPRQSVEVSPDDDRTEGALQQSHDVATQDMPFLPVHPVENASVPSNPANDTQVSQIVSQREIELSGPGDAAQSNSYSPTEQHDAKTPPASSPVSDEPATPEKPQRPEHPVLPPTEMKWNAEKLVQFTEAKRIVRGKIGAYFEEDVRGNSSKSQRQRQLEAAKRILAKGVTEEEYVKAYTERNDEWWNQTQGSLTVEEMAANTKNRVMRILEILEKLDTISKAIGTKQSGQSARNATPQQQRTERAAQELAHSASMNGGLTQPEINKLSPEKKKAYIENLKKQNQQRHLSVAQ